MQQATEKWSSDPKNRTKIENHLSTASNLNLNGFGNERPKNTKNIGQEVNRQTLFGIVIVLIIIFVFSLNT